MKGHFFRHISAALLSMTVLFGNTVLASTETAQDYEQETYLDTEESTQETTASQEPETESQTQTMQETSKVQESTSEALPLNTVVVKSQINNDTMPDDLYSLEKILKSYNIAALDGDAVLNIHCMGAVLIHGSLTGDGSGFADSAYVNVPSYIGGKVVYAPCNSRYANSGNTLYVGSSNTVTDDNTTLNGNKDYNHKGKIYVNDNYIDWPKLKNVIESTSGSMMKYSSQTIDITPDETNISIEAGRNISMYTHSLKVRINIDGTSKQTLIINILDAGEVFVPQILGLQTMEDNQSAQPIVFNIPNASKVIIPSELTPEFGHVIAPKADITAERGNYNGCLIGKSIYSDAEGHLWPYNGQLLVQVKAEIKAHKALEGRVLNAGEFSFTLWENQNAVAHGKNDADGNIVFDTLTYTQPGEHVYELTEDMPEGAALENAYTVNGVSYDPSVKHVKVYVKNNKDGILSADVTYEEPAEFKNSYSAAGSWIVEGKKQLTGRAYKENETFEYVVEELTDNQRAIVSKGISSKDGNIIFEPVNYTKEGAHEYIIRELAGNEGGLEYDKSEFHVKVYVKNNKDGTLTAAAEYDKPILFTNIYSSEGKFSIKARKEYEGGELHADEFTFTVKENDQIVSRGAVKDTGEIGFEPIYYETAGEHVYKITEDIPDDNISGIIYDKTEKELKVKVTDEGNGKLLAEAENDNSELVFKNKKLHFYIKKADAFKNGLSGAVLELIDKNTGKILDTWMTKKDEIHDFGAVIDAGKDYILRESKVPEGYAYAKDINISIDTEGNIITDLEKVTDNEGKDIYLVINYTIEISILKTSLDDGKPLEGASLEIRDASGKLIDSWISDKNPRIIDGKLEAGKYYVLKELSAPEGYLIADDIVFNVDGNDTEINVTMPDEKEEETTTEAESTSEKETTAAEKTTVAEKTTAQEKTTAAPSEKSHTAVLGVNDNSMMIGFAMLMAGGIGIIIAAIVLIRKSSIWT